MNDNELEKLIKSNAPNAPYIECNSKKILKKCKIQKSKSNKQISKYFLVIFSCTAFCFIMALLTIHIVNRKNNNVNALNVDMGKNPYLAREGLSQELYKAAKINNPDWEPIFDKMIAFGPESANGTVNLSIIKKSHLLSIEDKQSLVEYEKSIKKKYPNHNVSFQISFGVKDNNDYIYLIDYCGYDSKLKKEVCNEFLFKSYLTYSFESIVSEFEVKTGRELTDEFLINAYYDDQNLLSSGIIIKFIEVEGLYQEYYFANFDGELFVVNKQ